MGGGGDIIATEDVNGIKFQRVKVALGSGTDGGNISATNPLPVGMSYFDADSTMLDAFGRLRVSMPEVLGFGSFEYGLNASFVETAVTGTGAVASLVNESSLSLSTGGAADGARAVAQTRIHHRYVPGRSQLIRFTGSFAAPAANVVQRSGYYNDRNGFFIEWDGLDLSFVRRSYTSGSVVDTKIPRASWSDPFDGTGPSGIDLDLEGGTTWLAWLDMEWLGVGRYRFGFASPANGSLLTAYVAAGTNFLSVPYIGTANLPVRYEIFNSGAAAATTTMKWICYSVDTEGGDERSIPVQLAVDSNAASKALPNGAFRPILAIRAATTGPNSVPNRAQLILRAASAIVTGGSSASFRILLNPTTLTQDGGAVSWGAAGSITEVARFVAAGDTVAGGTIIDSFDVGASNQAKGGGDSYLLRRLPLVYTELGSVQDTVVLVGAGLGGNTTAFASMSFQEVF